MYGGDPYKFDDVDVLRNKLNIKNAKDLENAEAAITKVKLINVDSVEGNFDYKHLMNIHKHIFGDIYDWAGQPRVYDIEKPERVLTGKSVNYGHYKLIEKETKSAIEDIKSFELKRLNNNHGIEEFSKRMAALWQVHPFREGNTRTIMSYISNYLESKGYPIDRTLLRNNSDYVRNSLVMASIGEYSEYNYLSKIMKDAIEKGLGKSTLKEKLNNTQRDNGNKSYKMPLKDKER